MSVLFALIAAIGWGSSDFAAGHASRRSSAVSVVILTHFAAVVALVVVSVLPGQGGSPTLTDLTWGLAAGLGGGFGAMLLFRGLGRGSMAVVAPITATGAASIPVFAGVLQGDPITPLSVGGVVLALIAIVMVSMTGDDEPEPVVGDRTAEPSADWIAPVNRWAPPRGLPVSTHLPLPSAPGGVALLERPAPVATMHPVAEPPEATEPVGGTSRFLARPGVVDALLSGVGFGLFFVFIARTAETAGHWPLVSARGISVVMFVAVAMITRTAVLPEPGSRRAVVLAGCLDAAAALFFVLSTRDGLLSVGAVLASLYPAVTIVLARFISNERIVKQQLIGLVLAATAVSLLAI